MIHEIILYRYIDDTHVILYSSQFKLFRTFDTAEIFLKNNKNVYIEKGKDGTGNLYNPENLEKCMQTHQNSMNIITADGGFDFSIAFDKQENMAFRLILSQVMFALTMQKYKGHFILKGIRYFSSIYSRTYLSIILFLRESLYYKTKYQPSCQFGKIYCM